MIQFFFYTDFKCAASSQRIKIKSMPYRFATENKDYSDFASGRVFYGAPGHPVFPVRLISEVF
ncbi:MAG: hypothetical protein AB8G95_16690, partial [Anaerolineae bacterium]